MSDTHVNTLTIIHFIISKIDLQQTHFKVRHDVMIIPCVIVQGFLYRYVLQQLQNTVYKKAPTLPHLTTGAFVSLTELAFSFAAWGAVVVIKALRDLSLLRGLTQPQRVYPGSFFCLGFLVLALVSLRMCGGAMPASR